MFDFFKEVIINSNVLPMEEGTDSKGQPFKKFYAWTSATNSELGLPAPTEETFRVLRCADYKKSLIKDGTFYKTVGCKGVPAKVVFDLTPLTKAGTYRAIIDFSLDGQRHYSDYQYPWSEFHKPVMVEFEATTNPASNAKALAKVLKNYVPDDYRYMTVMAKDNKVTVTCTDLHQVIKLAKIQKFVPNADSLKETFEDDATIKPVISANVSPIGTSEWITENLRFPSYPNLRYASPNSDDLPVSNGVYDMYTFEYVSPRKGLHGQGTVGQELVSATHHVFFVLQGELSNEFETQLKKVATTEKVMGLAIKEGAIVMTDAEKAEGKTITAQLNGTDVSGSTPTWTVTPPFTIDNVSGATAKVKAAGQTGVKNGTISCSFGGFTTSTPVTLQAAAAKQ